MAPTDEQSNTSSIWMAFAGLFLATLLDLGSTFGIAATGSTKYQWFEEDAWGWVTETALDNAALAALRTAVLALIVCSVNLSRSFKKKVCKVIIDVLGWAFGTCYLLLSTKAVLVAMYGGRDTGKGTTGSGLLHAAFVVASAANGGDDGGLSSLNLIYISLAFTSIASYLQQICVSSVLTSLASRTPEDDAESGSSGASEPLLGGASSGEDGSSGADDENGEESKGKKKAAPASEILKALLGFAAPDWYILCTAFVFGALAAWAQALIPFYIGRIVDVTGQGTITDAFTDLVIRLLVVSAACAVFSGLRGSLFTLEYAFLNRRIRSTLFGALMKQDQAFFDKGQTGDVISRLSADVQSVSDSICLNSNVLSRSALQAAVVLYFMFTESEESWRLSVMTFVLVPVILVICKIYGGYYRELQVDIQSSLAEANSVAEEMVSSMTTVKSHAAETFAEGEYFSKLMKVFKLQKKQALVYLFFMVIQTFLPNAMAALILYYGGTLISQGAMNAGSLVAFMLYQQSLSAAFQNMGDVFSNLSGAVGAAEKVVEMIQKKPDIPNCKGYVKPSFEGEIELRDIVFSYPSRPHQKVLDGFSLTVKAGEVVALVGPSGGGKSSIVKLMQRFYIPAQGQVLYDGRDVGEYDPSWLRQQVAMVGQEPVLYARSIYENIIFGLPENVIPSREEVEEACKLANAHGFISDMPKGYDTNCGDKGVQISGGQKQRIAIARALVRKPRVLLLDEATSALDADSEHIVQEALDRVMQGRTVVVIAHRLSTVQDADRIVVVKSGRVVESGPHHELLQQSSGIYASLVARQMAKGSSASLQSLGGSLQNLAGFFGGGGSK